MTEILCHKCGHDIDGHSDQVDCLDCLDERTDFGLTSSRCMLAPSDIARALLAAEPTDAEVERAAKALFAIEEPDRNAFRWNTPNPSDPNGPFSWHDYWMHAARAALRAAKESRR